MNGAMDDRASASWRPYVEREEQWVRVRGTWISGPGLRDFYRDELAVARGFDLIDRIALIEWIIDDMWEIERLDNEAHSRTRVTHLWTLSQPVSS